MWIHVWKAKGEEKGRGPCPVWGFARYQDHGAKDQNGQYSQQSLGNLQRCRRCLEVALQLLFICCANQCRVINGNNGSILPEKDKERSYKYSRREGHPVKRGIINAKNDQDFQVDRGKIQQADFRVEDEVRDDQGGEGTEGDWVR